MWIVLSDQSSQVCDIVPSNRGRQSLVSSLIKAYDLDTRCDGIIDIIKAKKKDLESFHGKEFLDVLLKTKPYDSYDTSSLWGHDECTIDLKNSALEKASTETCDRKDWNQSTYSDDESFLDDDQDKKYHGTHEGLLTVSEHVKFDDKRTLEELERYGLAYDCEEFPLMSEYVKIVAGSSIQSALHLIKHKNNDVQNIVVNWYGGRHHCKKNQASGYCYVNDIVLAINLLRKRYSKVFYLDLDLHHGDGVESAFKYSKSVMTCSIHRYDLGFFPGTGSLRSSDKFSANIPLGKGLRSDSLMYVVENIIWPLIDRFKPDIVVIQSGCDGLGTEQHREWNLTIKDYSNTINTLANKLKNTPILILGGGGYNHTETAKCWTYLTDALISGGEKEEWDLIPDHKYLDAYEKDGYQFWTNENKWPSKMKDENLIEYLDEIRRYLLT